MKAKYNITALFLCFSFFAFAQPPSNDIILRFDPSWSFPLGAGVDQNYIYSSKVDCIEHDGEGWIDGGAVSTNFESKLITNYEELIRELNLSLHYDVSASLGIDDISSSASASLDLEYYKYFKKESNSISLMLKASSSYGRRAVLNPRLKSIYQNMLDNDQFEEFVTSCGTHFVRYESRIGQVVALVEISNLNFLVKERLKVKYSSSLEGSYAKVSNFKSNMSLNIDDFFQEAKKYGSISIKYYAIGSDGISSIADVIANSDDFTLGKIVDGISAAASDFTKEKSAPIEHRLVSFQPYGLDEILINQLKTKKLNELQSQIYDLYNAYDKITQLRELRPIAYSEYYKTKIEKINLLISEKIEEIKGCYNSNKCDNPVNNDYSEVLDEIVWPEDAITFTDISIVPKYTVAYTSSGEKKEVLKQLNLIGKANFFHNEYTRTITVSYLDDSNSLIQSSYNNSTNGALSLSGPTIRSDGLHLRKALLILDEVVVDLNKFYDENGRIVMDENVIQTIQKTIDEFNSRQYLATIETNDYQSYSQPVIIPSSTTIRAYK